MATCDDDSLHEENLDNTDNDKEVDDDVNESIFDDEEMKKIFKTSKKEVDELNWRTNVWMILWKPFVKMNIFKENSVSQIINHRKTKRCTIKPLKNLTKKYESNFPFSVKQVRIKFKNCVSQCKKISPLQKTASGVKKSFK